MNEQELQMLVEELSITYFSQAFLHKATFNSRLKTTGGRYHLSSHNLDFNPRILEIYGRDELVGVIKHELCHYHLHLQGSGIGIKIKLLRHCLLKRVVLVTWQTYVQKTRWVPTATISANLVTKLFLVREK